MNNLPFLGDPKMDAPNPSQHQIWSQCDEGSAGKVHSRGQNMAGVFSDFVTGMGGNE